MVNGRGVYCQFLASRPRQVVGRSPAFLKSQKRYLEANGSPLQ